MKAYLGPFLLIFLLSVGLTWLFRTASYRYGWVSAPRPERWHRRPTALFGGVAIYLAFLTGYFLFVSHEFPNIVLVLCASSIFLVGLFDDILTLKPQTKLIAQVVAAATLVYAGVALPFTSSPLLNFLITLVWLVGITNAMNLLDNMDGLCAGIAIIAGIYRALLCMTEGHTAGVLIALVFIGSLAGFLMFNFNPASIFMGDSGSLFIGFLLAGINISATHTYAKSLFSILLFPVLVLSIPIFDTTLVTLARKFSGRPVSVGGRDHSSHRLVAVGVSERRAVLILYTIAAVSGFIAYILYRSGFSYSLFFISLFIIGLVLFGVYLSRIQVYFEDKAPALEGRDFFQLISDIPHKRYIFLVIHDVILILTAYYGAYWLRFEGSVLSHSQFPRLLESFPLLLIFTISCFFAVGLYRYEWRYAGVRNLWVMLKGSTFGLLATIMAITYLYRFQGYSRGVFIIYWLLIMVLLAGSRLSFRMLTEVLSGSNGGKKVLIYGAGDGGELLLREIKNNRDLDSMVVGFLDDDISRVKTRIHGVPVLGGYGTAEFWIRRHRINEVIISTGKIEPERLEHLQEVCGKLEINLMRAAMTFEKLAG